MPAAEALAPVSDALVVVYSYDAATKTWHRYGPKLPAFANTLGMLRYGHAYWFVMSNGIELPIAQ